MKDSTNPPEFRATQPALLSANGTAQLLGVSRSYVFELDATERLPAAVRLGRRRLWSSAELLAWAEHGCPRRAVWEAVWREMRGAR